MKMSFRVISKTPTIFNKKNKKRKGQNSFIARNENTLSKILIERASSFTSKASITLEATISVSFFLLGTLCLIVVFQIMVLQMEIKSALHSVGKQMAAECYTNNLFLTNQIEQRLIQKLGKERLDRSLIVAGSSGIDCSSSKKYYGTTIMDLCAYYQLQIPFFTKEIPMLAREEIIRVKGWTGEEDSFATDKENQVVYITEYGIVYHSDMDCTYLDITIQAVNRGDIPEGYALCERCKDPGKTQAQVYITKYGERYHTTLECSGLHRNIYAVPLSDVYGIGGCSKCTK